MNHWIIASIIILTLLGIRRWWLAGRPRRDYDLTPPIVTAIVAACILGIVIGLIVGTL
jgi:Na+/citrate or Na+/malate symporter